MVCDKQHMKDGWKEAGREAAEAEARDRESKTRTPHKVVGKKSRRIASFLTLLSSKMKELFPF